MSWRPLTPLLYHPFGFVAGCIWGDDSTWKIQYLDLSEAEKGIVKREERFGYIELPDNLNLKDAIDLEDYLYDVHQERDENEEPCSEIYMVIRQKFELSTGKRVD